MASIFDTHCHYNLDPFFREKEATYSHVPFDFQPPDNNSYHLVFNEDKTQSYFKNLWVKHLTNATKVGVEKSLIIGIDRKTSEEALFIASSSPDLYATIGIHPHEYIHSGIAEDILDFYYSDLTDNYEIAESLDTLPIAVGETGLDFFRLEADPLQNRISRDSQVLGFRNHVRFANEKNLPLILHVRDSDLSDNPASAYWQTLEILKKYKQNDLPFILHCVSGPKEYVVEALSMGAYVSVAGNITYKNAPHIRELATIVPPDKLLLETDAPFLPPQQYRGQLCEPWMISLTAEYVQKELGRDLDQIYENSLRAFNLQ